MSSQEVTTVNRLHSELHLAILGSREHHCLVSKNYKTGAVETVWLRREEVIPYVEKMNREGYTVWISINDKERGKDSTEGVCALCDFWIDIDSNRPDKSRPATKEELEEALMRASKLKEHIEVSYGAYGFMAYSGNGFHIHFPLPRFELFGENFRNEINKKVRAFAKKVSAKAGAKIDSTYDIRRVTTLIGSLNLKIPDHPIQTRWSKEVFKNGLEEALRQVEHARRHNRGLLEAILNMEVSKPKVEPSTARKHPRFEDLLKRDVKLRDLYNGDWEKYGYPTRSEAEEALLVKLVRYGFSDTGIFEIMEGSQIGKWYERPDSYRTLSVQKARKYVATGKDELEPIILGHLNMIEDPDLAGKPVIVEAVVSSTSIAYLAPTEIEATIEEKKGLVTLTEHIDKKNPMNIKLVGCNEDTKYRRLKRLFGTSKQISVKGEGVAHDL